MRKRSNKVVALSAPTAPANSLVYEPGLDGLRALAILAVLAFHLDISVLHGGFIGVDIFYVISGYLITRIVGLQIESGHFNYADFIVRRARRLLPVLLLTIGLTLIGAFLLMSPTHFSAAAQSAVFAIFSLSNWSFWLDSDYFAASKHVRPLLHTWSLGVEVQFYIVWPLILSAVLKFRGPVRQLMILSGFALVSFAAATLFRSIDSSATFYLSPFRIWQFAAGGCTALLALHFATKMRATFQHGLLATGLGLLGLALYLISPQNYNPLSATLPTAATCALLLGLGTSVARSLLGHPYLAYTGKISYSLYLVHWPIIILYRYWVFGPLQPIEMFTAAALSFVAAIVLYHFVETPYRRPWTREAKRERFTVGIRLGALACSMALIASLVPLQKGWDWRLPNSVRAAQSAQSITFPCGANISVHKKTGCVFAKTDTHDDTIVLVGDSHALTLAKGLKQTALMTEKFNATVILRLGVLPFHGVTTYGGEWKAGDFGATFDTLASTSPDTIILHARFGQYWWSRDETSRWPTWLGSDQGSPQAILPSQTTFLSGLEDTIDRLKASGANVLIVGAVPYPGLDSSQCLLRPRYLISETQANKSCTGYSRTASVERASQVNSILRDRADASGFVFVDPLEIFCAEDTPTCMRQFEGQVIYADENHLNQIGASILADAVWRALKVTRSEGHSGQNLR